MAILFLYINVFAHVLAMRQMLIVPLALKYQLYLLNVLKRERHLRVLQI